MASWGTVLHEPRAGVMLHYDASASDAGAVAWLRDDPRCHVSYNWLILDDGSQITIAPMEARAWHAGVCQSSNPDQLPYKDANSAFYGLAIAATDGQQVTDAQKRAVVRLSTGLFIRHRWNRSGELWRIVGHDTEAWPRGRKHDPTGSTPAHPVMSVAEIRELVRT